MAEALAAAGAAVAVLARSADELAATVAGIEARGGKAIALPADVTDRAAVEKAVATTERALGPLDLLVNNAGAAGPFGALWELDPDVWWRALDINLRGPVLCARAGAIPIAGATAYCSSKAALIRLTDTLAAETEPHGISVFALGPGVVRTRMTEWLMDDPAPQSWIPWVRRVFDEGRDDPIERAGQLIVLLALGQADALSGRVADVRGDLEALLRDAEAIQRDDRYTLRLRT